MKYNDKITGRVNPDEERRKRLEHGELTELEYNMFVKAGLIQGKVLKSRTNKNTKCILNIDYTTGSIKEISGLKESDDNIEFDKTDENVIRDAISRNENVRNMPK